MHKKLLVGLPLLLLAGCAHPAKTVNPNDPLDLGKYEGSGDIALADKFLGEPPLTIVAYPVHPANGSKTTAGPHDFYSEADYSWPDPKNPTGPFVGHDGQTSPSLFLDHRRAMWRLNSIVPTLTSAYLLTNDPKYSAAAIEHLRAWFITPETRMNPSLNYAQAIPFRSVATQYGLIDTLHLVETARSIVVLRKHHQLNDADDAALTKWFADYIAWLTTSKLGVNEGNGTNNHAVAYWLQIAVFAQVANEPEKLDEASNRFKTQLMKQMAADGSFPRELARTKPYGYSLFQLDLMIMLAKVLSSSENNLFEYKTENGHTLKQALSYMYPYVKDKTLWPKPPDVMVFDQWPVRSCAWLYGGLAYNDPAYIALWKSLKSNPTNEEVIRNLPIRHYLLWE